jgi:putative restriction endonuclease
VDVALTPAAVVSPYLGPEGRKGTKVQRLVQERPGQIKFRRTLKSVYGNKCCISDCTVAEALDGAHIDPYEGPRSNHQQNGLLLRRDLHALFDAGLLAIEPESRLVYLAPDPCDWAGYRPWHGKKLLSNPLGGEANAPANAALLRRWTKFVERFEPQFDNLGTSYLGG